LKEEEEQKLKKAEKAANKGVTIHLDYEKRKIKPHDAKALKKRMLNNIVGKIAQRHIQIRILVDFHLKVYSKPSKQEIELAMKSLDISLSKPPGPISFKASLLIEKLFLDLLFDHQQSESFFQRPKGGIFENERTSVRFSKRADKANEINLAERKKM